MDLRKLAEVVTKAVGEECLKRENAVIEVGPDISLKKLAENWQRLGHALRQSALSPTEQHVFDELFGNISRFLTRYGEINEAAIEHMFTSNEETRELARRLSDVFGAARLGNSMASEQPEFQFGIVASEDKLDTATLKESLVAWDRHLSVLHEVVTGQHDRLVVHSISRGSLELWLAVGTALAAALAHAIERITTLYKRALEIQKLRLELQQMDATAENQGPLESIAKSFVSLEIAALVERLISESPVEDTHRLNELRIATRDAIWFLADQIDIGTSIDVSSPRLAQQDAPDDARSAILKEGAALKTLKRDSDRVLRISHVVSETTHAEPAPEKSALKTTKKKTKKKTTKKTANKTTANKTTQPGKPLAKDDPAT